MISNTTGRRRGRIAAAFFAIALTLAGCGDGAQQQAAETPAEPDVTPAELVLRGGKIATVDPEIGEAEAVAVTGHEITAVGSNDEIAAYVGPDTEVIELDGRLAIPGFIEGHGHYLSLGRAKQILDLNNVANWDEVVNMVAVAADQAEPGEWIFGRGWHQDKWDSVPEDAVDGVPRNDSLSAVSAENPVLLGHASGHAAFANDAALAAAGIDTDTEDPPGGTIVRAPDGEATGLLRETAQRLVDDAVDEYNDRLTPEQQDAVLRQRVQLAAEEALRHGVTSFHDAGADFATIDFFEQLESEGELPVRLYVMVRRESNEDMAARLPEYRMVAEGNDFLTVRSIKRQIDGALGAHGAWLLEPYADLPDSTGLVLEPVEDIERTAEIAVEHGFQVNTHAIGTRANREVLDLYERVWQRTEADGNALRWRIEHAQHIHPDDVPRFGELGVIAAAQGVHCTSDGPWIPTRLGEARTEATSYLWRDLIETGALIGNGTDVPVEPINAIASYYASVSRMMRTGEKFHPDQAMTRGEALRSYTINNAYAAFEEDIKGSITPGKLADITVLSQDILTIPEAEIPETQVDMTFVGGELAYAR
ncbi:MAG: amidohydrolase family protein [Gammaproteobacteria bacterium]|jgi:predicted amidohydrolase YtcJ|nr:amidohydrolase family protein [Gammaproteobacteria bacterium]